jgi:hypothetical protein
LELKSFRKADPGNWRRRLQKRILAEPLFDARASLASLAHGGTGRRPEAVFMGVGLCAREELSRAVPLDLLGMLLPAEIARRELGAETLLVLIADEHARENGFSQGEVEARARAVEEALGRLREACGLRGLEVLRASSFHQAQGYQATLEAMRRKASRTHAYLLRQFADLAYLGRERGPLLKVGWALRGSDPFRQRDERILDKALRGLGEPLECVYCKPARTLADEAPRMPPYVVKRPEARLCIDRAENAQAKLARAEREASPDTVAAFRRQLRRLIYTWSREVRPLPNGPLEARTAALLAQVIPIKRS